MNRKYWILGFAASVVAAAIFPFIASSFQLRMVTEIIIMSLFVMTWKMMLNEGGMFSFGHAVYFGVGAYTSVLGWMHISGLSLLSGILLGALCSALLAMILGLLLVRMSGTYFSLLTLAFNQLVWAIVWKWRDVTGGDDGLGRFPKPDIFGISMRDPFYFYFMTLLIIGVCFLACWYFTRSPLGNICASLKSNEDRAKYIGINVNVSKLIFFVILGFFAGVSGALFAQFQEFISTSTIDGVMSTNVLFMAYIGGLTNFWGPLAGSTIFVYLSEYLSSFTERWELILGIVFIVIVLFSPQGIMGILKRKRKG